jgi:hypothetical protein
MTPSTVIGHPSTWCCWANHLLLKRLSQQLKGSIPNPTPAKTRVTSLTHTLWWRQLAIESLLVSLDPDRHLPHACKCSPACHVHCMHSKELNRHSRFRRTRRLAEQLLTHRNEAQQQAHLQFREVDASRRRTVGQVWFAEPKQN